MLIKRQAVDLLVTNILKLNIKNLTSGIVRIKMIKDDFDVSEGEEYIRAGSNRDNNMS